MLVKQLMSQFTYDAVVFLQVPFAGFLHIKELVKISYRVFRKGIELLKVNLKKNKTTLPPRISAATHGTSQTLYLKR